MNFGNSTLLIVFSLLCRSISLHGVDSVDLAENVQVPIGRMLNCSGKIVTEIIISK